MRKLIVTFLVVMLIAANALAMGGRPNHHNDHQSSQQAAVSIVYRESGPIFKAHSELASMYVINIGDVSYIQEADEDGYLDFDLFPLNLPNGRHLVKITPINFFGEAPTVEFNLQISGKNLQLWQIVLIPKLVKDDPEYKSYFSEDLSVYVPTQQK
jgi:hypothetical protein